MATGAVHVTVREFFLRRIANGSDLNLEVQALAGQRMIPVQRDHVARDACHRHGSRPLLCLRLQSQSNLKVRDTPQGPQRNLLDELLVVLAVAIGSRQLDA